MHKIRLKVVSCLPMVRARLSVGHLLHALLALTVREEQQILEAQLCAQTAIFVMQVYLHQKEQPGVNSVSVKVILHLKNAPQAILPLTQATLSASCVLLAGHALSKERFSHSAALQELTERKVPVNPSTACHAVQASTACSGT